MFYSSCFHSIAPFSLRSRRFFALAAVLFLVLTVSQPSLATGTQEKHQSGKAGMNLGQAIVVGLTEGLTEYLPVSSTGHLYLVERLIGIGNTENERAAADAYVIAVQIGAILAVLWLYFGRVKEAVLGVLGKDKNGRALAINLVAAFLPAVFVGLALEKAIKAHLFGLWPIAAAWLAGGIAILLTARSAPNPNKGTDIESLTVPQSLAIGVAQCVAMWPGVSRSLVTIIAGKVAGLSTQAAVEFSFLLGLITLGAATSYEIAKEGSAILAAFGWLSPLIGLIVAFISAVIAVKWMVAYLNRRGLGAFGYYRVALAVVAFCLIMGGIVR